MEGLRGASRRGIGAALAVLGRGLDGGSGIKWAEPTPSIDRCMYVIAARCFSVSSSYAICATANQNQATMSTSFPFLADAMYTWVC